MTTRPNNARRSLQSPTVGSGPGERATATTETSDYRQRDATDGILLAVQAVVDLVQLLWMKQPWGRSTQQNKERTKVVRKCTPPQPAVPETGGADIKKSDPPVTKSPTMNVRIRASASGPPACPGTS